MVEIVLLEESKEAIGPVKASGQEAIGIIDLKPITI
jgi:hypothetical protein